MSSDAFLDQEISPSCPNMTCREAIQTSCYNNMYNRRNTIYQNIIKNLQDALYNNINSTNQSNSYTTWTVILLFVIGFLVFLIMKYT